MNLNWRNLTTELSKKPLIFCKKRKEKFIIMKSYWSTGLASGIKPIDFY